ncbi:ribonuclease P protein subunit [Stygiolobus azoricus]|uniref:ribonuclease P protein subunit n=1 Tax=Stygiolobus azoricus TaxID=41675 RepID=UPI0018C898C1|nr:ribonuclease P protein subunit [Stygiolobus azoricus]
MDLIGAKVTILSYPDSSLLSKTGVIIDETYKTLVVGFDKRKVRLLKENGIYAINFKGRFFVVSGIKLVGKPEKRWM